MATYFVDVTTGNDADNGLTEGTAWQTITRAMDSAASPALAAGDKVWVKASADYLETTTIDTNGTAALPIEFEGYTSSTGDGGQVTINGGASRASGIVDSLAAGARYYVFKNFILTNHTAAGVNTDGTHLYWKNCWFNANGTTSGSGYNGSQAMFERCQFNDNTLDGANISTTGAAVFVGCKFYSNDSDGIDAGVGIVCYGCEFFGNANENINAGKANDAGGLLAVFNCTFDGNNEDSTNAIRGNATTNRAEIAVVNCIAYDCQTGITGAYPVSDPYISLGNLLFSNTANYSGFSTPINEVLADPEFTNEAGNDYTLDEGAPSPAIDTGYDLSGVGMDIGAHQTTGSGGGGGGMVGCAGIKTGGAM